MTIPRKNTGGKPPSANPNKSVPDKYLTNGASPRTFTPKAWDPGKPPGGRRPLGPTAQHKSASTPDKPAK